MIANLTYLAFVWLGVRVVESIAGVRRKGSLRGQPDDEATLVLNRMEYYKPADGALPITKQFMLFDADDGGPNNIRIGWEMTGVMALQTGRTLVLPPPSRMYLLDYGPGMQRMPEEMTGVNTVTSITDLINMHQLRGYLPTITAEEFEAMIGTSWAEAVANATRAPTICKADEYRQIDAQYLFMSGKDRTGFSCGDWASLGGPSLDLRPSMDARGWSLLAHGFVWHEDVFKIASQAVSFLGLFNYSALHARYNDFQYADMRQNVGSIWNSWGPVLTTSPKIYIASDEPDKVRALVERSGSDIFTFDDMLVGPLKDIQAQYSKERWFKLTGPVEELICTFSKVFLGTRLSTFSGHINRMRVHAQAPITRALYHTEPLSREGMQELVQEIEGSPSAVAIVREYPTAGDIFLQMESESNVA